VQPAANANPGQTVFEVSRNATAVRGRRLTLPISVRNNTGFAAVGFEVGYEPGELELIRAVVRSTGENPPSEALRISRETVIKEGAQVDGTQWITLVDVMDLKDWEYDGVLLNLEFDVIAPVGIDDTIVTVSFTSLPSGRPVSVETGQILPGVTALANNGQARISISDSVQGPDGQRPPGTFGVTLQNGGTGAKGQGWYAQGATVNLEAGTAPTGQQFSHWTATPAAGVTFASANSANTSFSMPSNDVTVTANWVPTGGGGGDGNQPPPAGQFQLRVVGAGPGGTQTGNHAPGATVTLNAGTPPTGQTFVNWTRGPATGGNLTNPTSATAASITLPANITAVADRIITVTANWSGGGSEGGGGSGSGNGSGEGGNGGGGSGSGNGGGGSGSGSGTAHGVLQHFGTWTGSGTREGRVNADHSRFVRLTRGGTEISSAHYTVTAGSTIITLNESYIATLPDGTYVFRAEFTDGHADLNLIVSTGFGNVPQTGVADITLQVVAMWVSVFLAASLCVCLFFYKREMRKRANVRTYYGKQK